MIFCHTSCFYWERDCFNLETGALAHEFVYAGDKKNLIYILFGSGIASVTN